MKTFELRIIERKVRVFQVEAENEEAAQEIFEVSDSSNFEVESFPIDSETEDWRELDAAQF
jgi:hypothetical protein